MKYIHGSESTGMQLTFLRVVQSLQNIATGFELQMKLAGS